LSAICSPTIRVFPTLVGVVPQGSSVVGAVPEVFPTLVGVVLTTGRNSGLA